MKDRPKRTRLGIVQRFALRSMAFVVVMGLVLGLALTYFVRKVVIDESATTAQVAANALVLQHVRGLNLSVYPIPADLKTRLDTMMREDLEEAGISTIKLWNDQGVLLYSSDGEKVGESFSDHPPFRKAMSGRAEVELAFEADEENEAQVARIGRVIEVYAPLRVKGETVGVFEIYQRYDPVAKTIREFVTLLWLIIIAGSVPAYVLQLTLVKRTADDLCSAQGAVQELNERLKGSLEDMELYSLGTMQALVSAVDAKDSYTARHSIAVTDYAVAIARRMGLPDSEVKDIERAGLLHDVGKIGTPESILLKGGKITPEEFEVIKKHSEMGGHIVEAVPFLSKLMPTVRGHHERWDGSGYPDGLAGGQIPLYARILAVADAFDAMTSERPYRLPVTTDAAAAELERCANSQFDPAVVAAMLEAVKSGDANVVVHGAVPAG